MGQLMHLTGGRRGRTADPPKNLKPVLSSLTPPQWQSDIFADKISFYDDESEISNIFVLLFQAPLSQKLFVECLSLQAMNKMGHHYEDDNEHLIIQSARRGSTTLPEGRRRPTTTTSQRGPTPLMIRFWFWGCCTRWRAGRVAALLCEKETAFEEIWFEVSIHNKRLGWRWVVAQIWSNYL